MVAWVLLLAPLASCILNVLIVRKSKPASAALAIGAMAISLLCSIKFLMDQAGPHAEALQMSLEWVNLPGLMLEFGFLIDRPAVLMSLVVTGVGLMIFIYSAGYMAHEEGFSRYFACLSLFAFSMLGIVLANNFVTLFMFWELVGASSYLLIGFWYQKPSAAEAGKKAFLVNRIADFGFLLGILMLWNLSGFAGEARTLNFHELPARIEAFLHSSTMPNFELTAIALLIFCGVLGKSAQFPLHVWLPDAMEGPTPVSALIHAATMVAAGVYLLARVFFLFWASDQAMMVIAIIGGFTALFAASLALVENDIKRVLAFSTLSQLGYMVMALGLGGYVAGIYHLTTHAFFKALLFLGAGCVIHAAHTNDIWKMGNVFKQMPVTSWTFAIATLALCGIFPLSGFWSKDEILTVAFERNKLLWVAGTITAGLTAFYMGRLFSVAFLGKPRSHEAEHLHEAPPVMTLPLVMLTIPTIFAGFFGLPHFLHHGHNEGVHVEFNLIVAVISSVVALVGLGIALAVYAKGWRPLEPYKENFALARQLLARKFYVDEIYAWINKNIQQRLAILLALFEKSVIIGLWANGIAKITGLTGSALRLAQTGKVQDYAMTVLGGVVLFAWIWLQWAR